MTPYLDFRGLMDLGFWDEPMASEKEHQVPRPKSLLPISALVHLEAQPASFLGLQSLQKCIWQVRAPNSAFRDTIVSGARDAMGLIKDRPLRPGSVLANISMGTTAQQWWGQTQGGISQLTLTCIKKVHKISNLIFCPAAIPVGHIWSKI